MTSRSVGLALLVLYGLVVRGGAPLPSESGGLVILELAPGSALASAGARTGDRFVGWARLGNDGQPVEEGELVQEWRWRWLESELAARGELRLRGWRGDRPIRLDVATDGWASAVRPWLPRTRLGHYLGIRGAGETGERPSIAGLRELAAVTAHARAPEAVWLYGQLAEALLFAGRSAEAREVFQRSLALVGPAPAPSLVRHGWAAALMRAGELEPAAALFGQVADELDGQGLVLGAAAALHAKGDVALEREDLDRARSAYEEALELRRANAPRSLGLSSTLRRLGVVVRRQGHFDAAERLYEEALELVREVAPDSPQAGYLLNNLGVVAESRGDLESAAQRYESALAHFERIVPDASIGAITLSNLSDIARKRGQLDLAERHLNRAIDVLERVEPDGRGRVLALADKAVLLYERGQFDRAESVLLQAGELEERRGGETHVLAMVLNRLAKVSQAAGDLATARDRFERALAILERTAPNNPNLAAVAFNLGDVARERGDLARAERRYRQAEELLLRVAPDSVDLAAVWRALGEIRALADDPVGGRALLEQALEHSRNRAPRGEEHVASLASLGRLQRQLADPPEAVRLLGEALTLQEAQVEGLSGWWQAGHRARTRGLYRDLIWAHLESGGANDAFRILERFRSVGFLAMIAERPGLVAEDLPEELVHERAALNREHERLLGRLAAAPAESGEVELLEGQLESLALERDELIERLRRASPRLSPLLYPESIRVEELAGTLSAGTALLTYAVADEGTAVFGWSRSGGLRVAVSPVGGEELHRLVGAWRRLAHESTGRDEVARARRRELADLGATLYKALVSPVEGALESARRVLVVPDGVLNLLPFAALVRDGAEEGRGREYLVEWKPIHVTLSVSTHRELERRRSELSRSTDVPTLVAFGDPESRSERLAGSRREVEGIVALFPPTSVRSYLGSRASESNAASSMTAGARFIHFATHATVDDRRPLDSALVLSSSETTSQSGAGLLQAWEILSEHEIDAELVVLSACDTALTEGMDGEGIVSMTRAFRMAGAGSVLASLWKVPDEVAPDLMIRFYEHLRSGSTKIEALRRVQLEAIRSGEGRGTGPVASDPYLWAAFQLYGDWS